MLTKIKILNKVSSLLKQTKLLKPYVITKGNYIHKLGLESRALLVVSHV